jgi:uncharacterized DUF497 family protein
MRFEWDERKNRANRRKHGVAFETATMVFDDPYAVTQPDIGSGDEERWVTLGAIEPGLILFVVHTHSWTQGEDTVRIISARKAESRERNIYAEAHKNTETRYTRASRKARRRH